MNPYLTVTLPVLFLTAGALLVLLLVVIRRSHVAALWITLAACAAAFVALFPASAVVPIQLSTLLRIDTFALFFTGVIVLSVMAVAVLAYGYFRTCDEHCEELYALLLLASAGSVTMAASVHFVSFVLGLEVLSVSLYVLLGYQRSNPASLEAALKYLVLASVSSTFLFLGLALLYFTFGTMELAGIATRMPEASNLVTMTGIVLAFVGIGFKLALVPFHVWTPDVYQGAPAPMSAFVATIPKAAMLAFAYRFLAQSGLHLSGTVITIVAILAGASMIVGNILALLQGNIKRLLAYSSVAHMGYAVVGLVAGGEAGLSSVGFYVVAYLITTLGAFGIVSALSSSGAEWQEIEDYRGLFWRKPAVAFLLAGSMLSLAGIPLTVGFIGKFLVLTAGVGSALWTLSIILVLTSAVGLYYYLRVTVVLFTKTEHTVEPVMPMIQWPSTIVLALLAVSLLFLGVYPSPVLGLLQTVSLVAR